MSVWDYGAFYSSNAYKGQVQRLEILLTKLANNEPLDEENKKLFENFKRKKEEVKKTA